jgi:hypothetical protein
MFRIALGRSPAGRERTRFEDSVAQLAAIHGIATADILQSQVVWQDVAHAMFNVKEFVYIP